MSRWFVLTAFVAATTLTGACRNDRNRNNPQPSTLPTESTGTTTGSSGAGAAGTDTARSPSGGATRR